MSTTGDAAVSNPTFDPDAVRERYRQERDKRIRDNGPDQYLEMAGTFAHFAEEDPYADPGFTREPIAEDFDIAIIGGGFSGLLAAARLIEQGVSSFRIIEAGADFGGTWYWNRYPGAMCDTAAMVYLPLLEETGTVPSAKYVPAPEIQAHARRIADTFDLRRDALLSTGVESIAWDESL